MKRFGLGVLSLVAAFVTVGSAHAGVLPIVSTRLEMKVAPVRNHMGKTLVIDVDSSGDVNVTTNGGAPVLVDHFSVDKMDQIENYITQASSEELQKPDPGAVHCMAMPVSNILLTANSGALVLQSGAVPCGFVTRRQGSASDELMQILFALDSKFNRLNP